MTTSYLADHQVRLTETQSESPVHLRPPARIGIFLDDPLSRRLIESACVQLDLQPVLIDEASLDVPKLVEFEMVVTEEPSASRIRSLLGDPEQAGDATRPGVVIVRHGDPEAAPATATADAMDGVICLPSSPAPLAAQLSLLVYSHRSFARRYNSTLEELNFSRLIFRSVTSGISVADARLPDAPLLYVNPAFEVMTGYTFEEVKGKNCRFLQRGLRDQPGLTEIREAYKTRSEVKTVLKNFRKDGTPFWNELSLSPIFDRQGVLTHFVGIQNDVTVRVEFESALRESEKLAAVGRLAASIAHEINNPLESVMNLLYLANRADDLAETRHYIGMADKELQRVALITSQSLRFYKQSTKPQTINSNDLLSSVLDLYGTKAEHAHVSMERRGRANSSILCLESEIRQVLNNLVKNSLDSMLGMQGDRGRRLLIRNRDATDWATGVHGLMITVADTGSGMSAQTQEQIFKPFFTTKGASGTGLGLWISSEIVARHHGRLKVRSKQKTAEGRAGTVFQLFLPHDTAPAAA